MNAPARRSSLVSNSQPMRTLRKRLRPALTRNRNTSQGFLTPLGFITMLAIIGGLILEISRLNYGLTASIRTSEARKAIDAAAFGMEAILDDLNNNNNSYLLVTKFTNPSGTGTWQTVSAANLSACGLEVPSPAPSANRIAGVSSNSSSSSVALPSDPNVTYSLVSFEPPSGATAPASGCNMFGNLFGGRARMTVRGTVQRNGAIVASFESSRDVYIRTGGAPSAANNLGLVITGAPSASKLGSPFHVVFDDNSDGAISTSGSTITETLGNVNCILCSSPADLDSGGTTFGSIITGPIPGFPTFPGLPPELSSAPPGNLTSPKANYPYTGTRGVEPECSYLTEGGVANAAIGCRLDDLSLGGSETVMVRADGVPIRLFVAGDFVLSGSSSITVTDGNPATTPNQDRYLYWNKLWIYGNGGTPDASASNCNQKVTMSSSGPSKGLQMWFPLGTAKMSGSTFGSVDYFGSLWTCIFDKGSGNTGFLIPKNLGQTLGIGGGGYVYRATGGN